MRAWTCSACLGRRRRCSSSWPPSSACWLRSGPATGPPGHLHWRPLSRHHPTPSSPRLAPRWGWVLPWRRDAARVLAGGAPMNLDDGPMDPFLDDPDDPAALLDDADPV